MSEYGKEGPEGSGQVRVGSLGYTGGHLVQEESVQAEACFTVEGED